MCALIDNDARITGSKEDTQLSSGKDSAPANGGEVEEVEIPLPEDETAEGEESL